MSSDKRCFFALTFADEAKARLSQERDTLKAHADNGTFTHSEKFSSHAGIYR